MKNPDIKQEAKDIIGLGWNNVKTDIVDTLIDCTSDFFEKDITYRLAYMGEAYDDYEEYEYTIEKDDRSSYIPYPSIIRQFEEDMAQLEAYANYKEKDSSEMECE